MGRRRRGCRRNRQNEEVWKEKAEREREREREAGTPPFSKKRKRGKIGGRFHIGLSVAQALLLLLWVQHGQYKT